MGSAGRLRQLILRSASAHNVLPLTSVCNARCVFCSHSLDYPGLDVHRLTPRATGLVHEAIEFLSPDRKVIIGESATRIIEGEPLTHPQFFELLTRVRGRLPDTSIQVTTNGSLLEETAVRRLAGLGPVEVSLSLNAPDVETRCCLMRDAAPEVALRSPELLGAHGIPFSISLVIVPGVLTVDEASRTIAYAEGHGAQRAKVYVAGCSQAMLDAHGWRADPEAWDRLHDDLEALRRARAIPVTLQPARMRGLRAEVAGVAPGSQAEAMGLRVGDTVTQVDGVEVRSRSHAHELLSRSQATVVDLTRDGKQMALCAPETPDSPMGAVFDDDLAVARLDAFASALRQAAPSPVLILTSSLAESLVLDAVRQAGVSVDVTVVPVESGLFGGTIACAGLLTVDDFVRAGRRALDETSPPFASVLAPSEPFDERGVDLVGRSYLEVGEWLGVPVRLL